MGLGAGGDRGHLDMRWEREVKGWWRDRGRDRGKGGAGRGGGSSIPRVIVKGRIP
jgi:hypothetical protein